MKIIVVSWATILPVQRPGRLSWIWADPDVVSGFCSQCPGGGQAAAGCGLRVAGFAGCGFNAAGEGPKSGVEVAANLSGRVLLRCCRCRSLPGWGDGPDEGS